MPLKPLIPLGEEKPKETVQEKAPKSAGSSRARTRARDRFIRRLAESGNVADSLRKAGIPQRTAYNWRKTDPEFAALWKEAEDMAVDGLEGEARRRAVTGWDEPIFQRGRQVGVIKRYSDKLLEILLKGHRPEKYRENSVAAVQVNVGGAQSPQDREQVILDVARSALFTAYMAGRIRRQREGQALLPAPEAPHQAAPGATVEAGSAAAGSGADPERAAEEERRRREEAAIAQGDRLAELDVQRALRARAQPSTQARRGPGYGGISGPRRFR